MQHFRPAVLIYVLAFSNQILATKVSIENQVNWLQHPTPCASPETYAHDECHCFSQTPTYAKLFHQKDRKSRRNKTAIEPERTIQRDSTPMATKRHECIMEKLEYVKETKNPYLFQDAHHANERSPPILQRSLISHSSPNCTSHCSKSTGPTTTKGLSLFQIGEVAFGVMTLVLMIMGLLVQVLQIRRQRRRRAWFRLWY